MPVRPQEFDLASLPDPVSRRSAVVAPAVAPKPQADPPPFVPPKGGPVSPPAVASVPFSGPPLAPAVQIAGYKLFSTRAIFWATLLGSPLAGSILLGKNFRRLGRRNETFPSILLGLLATGTHLISLYESRVAGVVVGSTFLVGMALIARALQGTAVIEHKNRGGKIASGWAGLGIALMCLIGILVIISGVFAFSTLRT